MHENVAMKLATMLGTSASLWLNLQAKYKEKCDVIRSFRAEFTPPKM